MNSRPPRQFGKLVIDPALNPGVLDTATWDRQAAWAAVQAIDDRFWPELTHAAATGTPLPASDGLHPHAAADRWQETTPLLASLKDGQQVFLSIGTSSAAAVLGPPIGSKSLAGQPSVQLALYPTDAAVVDRYARTLAASRGPQALGPVPRLGIGTRMTTAVWPAIWATLQQRPLATNAIQNSVRELHFLNTLLDGLPSERNVAFGFGEIETGYTGSTYEGLWVAGVLDALRHGPRCAYGADADHIQVKRGADGLARARRLLEATRYYSFYTFDVSDVLNYAAMDSPPPLESTLPDRQTRRALLSFHRQGRQIGGYTYRPDESTLCRLAGKYWGALAAVEAMYAHLKTLKADVPFDLELSIDEHPNDLPTFACLTSENELMFVLLEAERRGIPLTHVAPNFGVEKGTDYRGEDGLAGLERRARTLCTLAEDCGVMADFHSGDDLSAATRQAIGRATARRSHFKVSPNLQLLFADVLADFYPELFRRWWEDALAYARRTANSPFARACLDQTDLNHPSPHDALFHHFSFAYVGRRSPDGQFLCREQFYTLSPAFYQAYQQRVVHYLLDLANDLFG